MDNLPPEWRKPGRRARVSPDEYIDVVLKFKDKLVRGSQVVPASNSVWFEISSELNGRVKGETIHSLTVSNRHGLLNKLFNRPQIDECIDAPSHSELEFDESNTTLETSLPKSTAFTITFSKSEFEELVTETSSIVKYGNKQRIRKYTILKQKKWTEILAQKIFNETGLEHGFHFKTHYIFRDATGGSCKGN